MQCVPRLLAFEELTLFNTNQLSCAERGNPVIMIIYLWKGGFSLPEHRWASLSRCLYRSLRRICGCSRSLDARILRKHWLLICDDFFEKTTIWCKTRDENTSAATHREAHQSGHYILSQALVLPKTTETREPPATTPLLYCFCLTSNNISFPQSWFY